MSKTIQLKLKNSYYASYKAHEPSLTDRKIQIQINETKKQLEDAGYDVFVTPDVGIEIIPISEDSIYVFNIDIGDMPSHKGQEYIDKIKDNLCDDSPFKGKSIFFACNEERRNSVQVLKKDPNNVYVFYIDVGNMGPAKASEYLEKVKNEINNRSLLNPSIFLAKNSDGDGSSIEILEKYSPQKILEDYFFPTI